MKKITSPVTLDIFDAIAAGAIQDLAPDEMTTQRFVAKYNLEYWTAERVLNKEVRRGTLVKVKRRQNGSVVNAFIPKDQ